MNNRTKIGELWFNSFISNSMHYSWSKNIKLSFFWSWLLMQEMESLWRQNGFDDAPVQKGKWSMIKFSSLFARFLSIYNARTEITMVQMFLTFRHCNAILL